MGDTVTTAFQIDASILSKIVALQVTDDSKQRFVYTKAEFILKLAFFHR